MSPDGPLRPSTPEEKLLRLIRGKAPSKAALSTAVQAAGSTSEKPRPAPGASLAVPSSVPWSSVVVGLLSLVLVVELILMIIQIRVPITPVTAPVVLSESAAEVPAEAEAQAAPVQDMPSFAANNAGRPLFVAPVTSGGPAQEGAAPSQIAKALAARLTLTGVIDGDPPQAIVEDTETQKTYFVTAGQSVSEGAVVEKVSGNSIILDLQGEKIQLTL